MRVLTSLVGGVILLTTVSASTVTAVTAVTPATPPSTHTLPVRHGPPNATDHGVDAETFHTLWSGDRDAFVAPQNYTGPERSAIAMLANGTDIPLDEPPVAAEQWNRGDLRDFPATDDSRSIHPPDATLTDGRFIKDATVSIFAVQPSTRARLTAGASPLYVAPTGSVLGAVDYRVDLPPSSGSGTDRTSYRLQSASITETRLLVNGTVIARARGSHTPELAYDDLRGAPGQRRRLTIEADVETRVERVEQYCTNLSRLGTCNELDHDRTVRSDRVTVRDSIDVVAYDLTVSGYRGIYPNGDLGLVVYKNQPWQVYALPTGAVHGVWRFYTARDQAWDTLTVSRDGADSTIRSPMQPLQVTAYPIETGPTPSPRANVSIIDVYGSEIRPPTLPTTIHLDALTEPYTASFGIATRTKTTEYDPRAIVATGLVRGVNAPATTNTFATVPISQSNLTLSIVNKTADAVTIRARLTDAQTGAPIDTRAREGYVVLDGERVNTSANGTVTKTFARPIDAVAARYEPGAWWRNIPGYTASSDVLYVRGTILEWLATLFHLAVPVSLFLLGVYLIDRLTGWGVWPPWRWV